MMFRKDDQPGTFELLARLPQQIVALARAEYENAKQEIVSAAKKAGIGAAFVVIALFFVFWAVAAFGIAAIAAISLALPVWAAALIVAGGLILLAAAAVFVGIALLKRGNPIPEQTLGRLEDDVNAFAEVRVNADQHPSKPVFHSPRSSSTEETP